MLALAAVLLLIQSPEPRLQLVVGVTDSGAATEAWLSLLRARLSPGDFRAVLPIRKPLSEQDRAWAELFGTRLPVWEQEIPRLAAPFHPVKPPSEVQIILGNRGGEDAFTAPGNRTTIGLDLSKLQSIYGDAGRTVERADRFFRHEYTHLLQKAWLQAHPYDAGTPLRAALLEIWSEGMGNWFSMSDQWRAAGGQPSARAKERLAELEPRLVARLAALACASAEQAAKLTADLSWGPFDRKWGALTAALWLEAEPGEPATTLREFVLAGPEGVWKLAERRVDPSLRAVLQEAQRQREICQ
ncbi:MAG TPA: hypothetical protein VFO95_02835 [Gemmatimonadales bacterium]|nr:hypothetical protein [Gemmatimonadales bacterium]